MKAPSRASRTRELTIEELIQEAIREIEAFDDDDARLDAVVELQTRSDQDTLRACIALCRSCRSVERQVGAVVLGQLGHSPEQTTVFREERFACLSEMLIRERTGAGDATVLSDVCYALGWLHDPRAIPLVLEHLSDPHVRVRRGVRHALSGHDDEAAILGLIALSGDDDAMVRDWATFSLAQVTTADTPLIREALNARLSDSDSGARSEAMMGLARRKDPRAIPAVVEALTSGRFAGLVLDAAAEIASPDLCSALQAARDHALEWRKAGMAVSFRNEWQEAVIACGCIGMAPDGL